MVDATSSQDSRSHRRIQRQLAERSMSGTRVFDSPGTLIALAALCVATQPTQAAWDLVPEVSVLVASDSNVRMRASEIEGNSTVLDGNLYLSNFVERGNIFIEPRVRADKYKEAENKNLENRDIFLRTGGVYNWSQSRIGFTTAYAEQNTTRSEIVDAIPDDPDLDDPPDSDTGRVGSDVQTRERMVVSPYVQFTLSPRSSLLLEARTMAVSYNNQDLAGFDQRQGYDNNTASIGIVRNVDPRNQITARFHGTSFQTESGDNQTDTFGVNGDFSRSLSDIWNMAISAGVQRSDYSVIDNVGEVTDNADTNFVFNLGFRRRGERTRLNFDVGRRVTPNSSGFVTVRDQFSIFAERALSPRLNATVGLRVNNTKSVDNLSLRDDRQYARVDFQLEWQLTGQIFLVFGYDYTSQTFEQETDPDTDSSAIQFGFTYGGRSRQ